MKSVIETGRRFRARYMSPGASRQTKAASKLPGILSAASLALLAGLTACDNNYTLAYVYAPSETTGTSGLINAYGVDNQTGFLRLLLDSPIPSGGRKPVAIVATPPDPTGKLPQALYVINHDDSNVVEFTIGTDGKIYPQNSYNTTGYTEATASSSTPVTTSGSYPVALAISPNSQFLYVAYTYQQGFTTASPGPGGITIFQINSDRSLTQIPSNGSTLASGQIVPRDFPIGRTPIAITVGKGNNVVYVVTNDSAATNAASTGSANQTLNLFAFAADSTGALSLLPGETINTGNNPSFGFPTGITPGGILADPAGSHLYVTDSAGNQVVSYALDAGTGAPTLLPSATSSGGTPSGTQPLGMTIDPSGKFLFVANSTSGSISEYTFDASGLPVLSSTAASTQAGTGTNCVTVEPTHGIYLYASNLISNSITGEQLVPADGTLKPIVNAPFTATALPVCAVAVPRFQ